MVCPFRVKMTYEYEVNMGTNRILEKSQTQEYPECYEDECPFWNANDLCERCIND